MDAGPGNWVNEVVDVYKTLTDVDKNCLLGSLLQESSYCQLYFLQESLLRLHHRDFIVLLPCEIVQIILSNLDYKSLHRCCQVSRRWNEVISSSHSVWQAKCSEIGLRFTTTTKNSIQNFKETYKTLCRSVANKMRNMHTGQAFKSNILKGHSKRVTAIKIWDKLLASGTDDGELFIWDTEINETISRHKLSEDFCVTCMSLDGQMLVVGSSTGYIASLTLDRFQHNHLFGQFSSAVFSIDFNFSLNLVVSGSADNMVKLWLLSSGQLRCTLSGHTHWVVKVLIRPRASQEELMDNLPDAYLVSMDKERILVWSVVKGATSNPRQEIAIPLALPLPQGSPQNFFTPGLHCDGRFLHFIRQHLDVKTSSILCTYDIVTSKMVSQIQLKTPVKSLQAVGAKYVCIITRNREYTEFTSATVLEKDTLKEMTAIVLPLSRTIVPDQPHIAFGSVEWLNGFDGYNTTGLVIAVGCEDGSIFVTKWQN